ncbi:type VII secretion protein EsaA [Streptococcus suis]|nr:type VII secretion protein EsaA [Streptococcus suis]
MDKQRIFKYGRNALLVLLLLLSIIGLNIAVQNNTSISKKEQEAGRQNIKLDVALVNEDNTVTLNGTEYNLGASYAKNIEKNTAHNWSTISRGTADKGLKEGHYQLLVTIPSDFSTKILDINNTNVDKATITYKINANGNLQVENEAVKVAKGIIADLQSQLIDMYMASILGNLYQAQRNVQTLSDTKVSNIAVFRNNLYQTAVDFKTLFPNLTSTADSTLAANNLLKEALSGNVTAYDSLNTAQTGLKDNLATLIEQRNQGKLSQEEFSASLLAMNSSVLSAETDQLFATIKTTQEVLSGQLGAAAIDETGEASGYVGLVEKLDQAIADLQVAIEAESTKLAEHEATISNFAETHLTTYYGDSLETIHIGAVLGKSTELPISLASYQTSLDQLILNQLAGLPSLTPADLTTDLNKLDPKAASQIRFDAAFAQAHFGEHFVASNDLKELQALAKELEPHLQAAADFKIPTPTTRATLSLEIPSGFDLVSWELNGNSYTNPSEVVALQKDNTVTVTLQYEKSQTTTVSTTVVTDSTSTSSTTGSSSSEENTASTTAPSTGTPVTTTEMAQGSVKVSVNNLEVTTAGFDWENFLKEQEAYRKAEVAYAAKVSEIISKYNQANRLLDQYYPVNTVTGERSSLTDSFFNQDAKSLLTSLVTSSITANLQSYSEARAQDQALKERLAELEGRKQELKDQLQYISTTNSDLAQQIANQLAFLEDVKARAQSIADGQEQQTALQGTHDTELAALATELDASLSITGEVKSLSEQNVEEATNVNTVFTTFTNDVQAAQESGENLSSEATALMERFESELAENGDFVKTFTSVLSNTYDNGVPNEVILDFLSAPLTESSSSVKATVNTYRPFTWILLLEMVALFAAYVFGTHRVIKAVKDKFKVSRLEDTDLVTVTVLSVLSLLVGGLIGVVSSQQLQIDSELIPTWVLMITLFSLLLAQGQYLLIKNAKGLGMGISFFMVISFIYLSNAIGTTASLTGLPATLKAINPLSVLENSLSGYFDGEATSLTVIATVLVLGLGFAALTAFVDVEKFLNKKED